MWLLVLSVILSCRVSRFCPIPTYPFSGQTNVALDSEITIWFEPLEELAPDHPVLSNRPRLYEEKTGEEVEAAYSFVPVFTIIPEEPLQADTDYVVRGTFGNNSRHHMNTRWFGLNTDIVSTYFSTSSAPSVLRAFILDAGTLGILFSEVILPEDLGALFVSSDELQSPLSFRDVDSRYPEVVYFDYSTGIGLHEGKIVRISGAGLRSQNSAVEAIPFNESVEVVELPFFLGGEECSL